MAGLIPDSHFPFIISVGEVPLPEMMLNDIEEVIINTNLHMPGMFSIRFRDMDPLGTAIPAAMQYADNPMFSLGVPVSIRAVPVEESVVPGFPIPLIKGEITSVEAQFDAGPASLVITGYDKSHRLGRGKKTATYMFMPDNLIVQKVTAAAGLLCTAIPTTGPPREYVLQNNQSDMDFLKDIARRNGYELVMNALGILMFKPLGTPLPGPPGPLLTWRKDLFSFNPRLSAAGQDALVQVHGSDSKKFPIEAAAPGIMPASGGAAALPQLALARSIFGVSKDHITDKPTASIPEALNLAKGRAMQLSSMFTQAEGEAKGNPRIQAGTIVMVAGVGVKFSGPYLVSSATHRYSGTIGYVTQFSVTGAQPDTLSDLLNPKPDGDGRINGVVIGQVTNNVDPLQLGRVKVKLPFLGLTPPIDSNWCRIASPWAGGKISGFLAIPEINDEVLVAFEHGDPNFPYIVGQLWNMLDRPPSLGVVAGGLVTKRIIKSRSGHVITLSDMPGKEGISIVDKTFMNKIEIDSIKNALSISTLGDVTIDCLNFKVNSKAMMVLEGAKVDVKAKALLNIESNGIAKIKSATMLKLDGAAIDIKANTMLKLGGLTVNINNGALEVM
jgi:hypothetical protein